jgi:hypothetical protein
MIDNFDKERYAPEMFEFRSERRRWPRPSSLIEKETAYPDLGKEI